MRIFPTITVGTTAFVFDPASGNRRLKYLSVKSELGGQTVYMGPTPETGHEIVDFGNVSIFAGAPRIKVSDYVTDLGVIQPGWVIITGTDNGKYVTKVYDGYIEFSSVLSGYSSDSLILSAPYYADILNGYPILAGEEKIYTDPDLLRGPISFATASGTATLNLLFELT